MAQFQNRVGPRWFQPEADMFKLLAKEEIVPDGVNRLLFHGLPVIALVGALTAALYVPMLGLTPAYSFRGDLIVTLYLLSLHDAVHGTGRRQYDRSVLAASARRAR